MSASGHQRKCSEGSNDVRFAAPSGHDCADLAGPFSARSGQIWTVVASYVESQSNRSRTRACGHSCATETPTDAPLAKPDCVCFQAPDRLNEDLECCAGPRDVASCGPSRSVGPSSDRYRYVALLFGASPVAHKRILCGGVQKAESGLRPNFFSVSGCDGMHLIYEALRKTNGATDGDALVHAMKGTKWESPRGPMSIDPETRDVVQNIYVSRVEKVRGELYNVEFATFEAVKDPVKLAKK
jgi:hypothetical protein